MFDEVEMIFATGKSGNSAGFASVKSLFFDRQIVKDALDKQTRNVFGKFGAFVRKSAQWSMKKAPKDTFKTKTIDGKKVSILQMRTSPPGSPPYVRTGLLKKFIFYSLDWTTKSVVVGPVLLRTKRLTTTTVPEVLEYGGMSTIYDPLMRKAKKVRVAPRPYMSPAFERGKGQLKLMWKNSIS